ncbi:hypothetical protein [Microbacterium sp. LWS13-1.2]|uniref:Uncharacterized protein n=1 Tax=Microbacterium sp. LWS13-1.2 TaxID=3135264 RepID=A0AAU6SC41_9MICO
MPALRVMADAPCAEDGVRTRSPSVDSLSRRAAATARHLLDAARNAIATGAGARGYRDEAYTALSALLARLGSAPVTY